MHKPKERPERFELLARCNILIGPGRAESTNQVNIEIRDI